MTSVRLAAIGIVQYASRPGEDPRVTLEIMLPDLNGGRVNVVEVE